MSYKAIGSVELFILMREAEKNNYNRQLDIDRVMEEIDHDGVHLIQSVMLHEHAAGEPVAPHVRCRVFIKMAGTMEPIEGWLDIELGRFNWLKDVEPAHD